MNNFSDIISRAKQMQEKMKEVKEKDEIINALIVAAYNDAKEKLKKKNF